MAAGDIIIVLTHIVLAIDFGPMRSGIECLGKSADHPRTLGRSPPTAPTPHFSELGLFLILYKTCQAGKILLYYTDNAIRMC